MKVVPIKEKKEPRHLMIVTVTGYEDPIEVICDAVTYSEGGTMTMFMVEDHMRSDEETVFYNLIKAFNTALVKEISVYNNVRGEFNE